MKTKHYIGFLMYDEKTYAARYYAPFDPKKSSPEMNVRVYVTLDPDAGHIELTGEKIISARAGLRGRQCIGTLIASAGNDETAGAAREILEGFPDAEAGVTAVSGLLAVRLLSSGNETVTGALRALWTGLRPLILGKEPVPPRVWAT